MEWITDRQPSAEDADKDGEVIMLRRADGRGNGATGVPDAYVDWRHVGPGVPWKHNPWPSINGLLNTPVATESKPQPAPEPVAADRPALAVGQKWKNRDGEIVTIVKNDGTDAWPFLTSNGDWYTINGFLLKHFYPNPRDLVELINEAPEPAPVSPAPEIPGLPPAPETPDIPEAIRSGAAPFYVVVASDDAGGVGGGHAMTWETQIPEGSTLQSVLQHRARLGDRYGTTYIAECRIIPELTHEVPAQQPQP